MAHIRTNIPFFIVITNHLNILSSIFRIVSFVLKEFPYHILADILRYVLSFLPFYYFLLTLHSARCLYILFYFTLFSIVICLPFSDLVHFIQRSNTNHAGASNIQCFLILDFASADFIMIHSSLLTHRRRYISFHVNLFI